MDSIDKKKQLRDHLARLSNEKTPQDNILRFARSGEYVVRVVPGIRVEAPDIFPSRETITVMGQRYIVPNSPLLHDYITQMRIRLFQQAGKVRAHPREKAAFDAAKGMFPKPRWFAPVVERGARESHGVRILPLNQKLYAQVYGFYADENFHEFTDPQKGRDLLVTVKPGSFGSAEVNYADEITIADSESPLSEDDGLAARWSEYVQAIDIDRVLASWVAPEADIKSGIDLALQCGGVRPGREPSRRFNDVTDELDAVLADLEK